MQNKLPLLIFIIAFYSCVKSPDTTVNLITPQIKAPAKILKPKTNDLRRFYINTLSDTNEILNICFNPDSLGKNLAFWKADADAAFNMNVSNDGLCHTGIDTVLHAGAKTYFVFTTVYYSGSIRADCHLCDATYSIARAEKTADGFEITGFKRNLIRTGFWGEPGEIALECLGKDTLLRIATLWEGNSADDSTATYFDLRLFNQVFEYHPYRFEGKGYEDDATMDHSEEWVKLKTRKKAGEYELVLTCTYHQYIATTGEVIRKTSADIYRQNVYFKWEKAE